MTALRLATESEIPHLSASSIADFLRCSMSWYGSRIAKWEQGPKPALEIGTATHKALTAYHEGRDHEVELLAAWKAMACAAPSGALARVLQCLELYAEQMQPHQADVAGWWFLTPIQGLPIPLKGEFDLVRAPALEPTEGVVVDWKTGNGRYWTQSKADSEIQPTVYWHAFTVEAELPPARFDYWVLTTSGGAPAVRTITTTRTAEDVEKLQEVCRRVYQRMLSEIPEPSCPKGWCRFPAQCGR